MYKENLELTEEMINFLSSEMSKEYEEKLISELKEKKDLVKVIESEESSIKEVADLMDSFLIFSVIFKKLAPEANEEILLSILKRIEKDGNVNIFSTELIKVLDEELERYENVVIVEDNFEKEAYIKLYEDTSSSEDSLFVVKTKEELASISKTDIKTITFAMKEEKVLKIYVEIFKEKGVEVFLSEPVGESFADDLKNHKNR